MSKNNKNCSFINFLWKGQPWANTGIYHVFSHFYTSVPSAIPENVLIFSVIFHISFSIHFGLKLMPKWCQKVILFGTLGLPRPPWPPKGSPLAPKAPILTPKVTPKGSILRVLGPLSVPKSSILSIWGAPWHPLGTLLDHFWCTCTPFWSHFVVFYNILTYFGVSQLTKGTNQTET